MKIIDSLRLAFRNFVADFKHFGPTLISITLLSLLVLLLSNFCWLYHNNSDTYLLNKVNNDGSYIEIFAKNPIDNGNILNKETIYNFADLAHELNIDNDYNINISRSFTQHYINDKESNIMPYIGRCVSNGITLIEGEIWRIDDEGKDLIWLSEEAAEAEGVTIGGTVRLTNAERTFELTVKGIVSGETSFADLRFFPIESVSFVNPTPEYKNIGEIRKADENIRKFRKANPDINVSGNLSNDYASELGYLVDGICIGMIFISLAISLVSILNTFKISVSKNSSAIGLLRSLGMRDRQLKLHFIIQLFFLIISATIIAAIIAVILGYFALPHLIDMLFGIMYEGEIVMAAKGGFWFLLPVFNVLLLTAAISAASIPMLRRYTRIDTVKIMNKQVF